ncbi:SURF1 family protein [Falsiroseomonas sp. HW251]|uniref:SURF1 family protein n=1 Tax=Falsiroseomonas sp. HW251 TaxID=3390998 RepID=UPI003D31B133
MRRHQIFAVLAALPVFALLCWLGTWQLQRLERKEAILARIAASMAGEPEPLLGTPEPFTRVIVGGRFDYVREAMLGVEARNGVLGTNIVTPLVRQAGPPILVVRGWIPLEGPQARPARPPGQVEIVGWVRPSEKPGLFSATDEPQNRRFYNFDVPAIAASMGMRRHEPFGIVALGPGDGTFPDPARRPPELPNDHLGYAITWYGLALSLVLVVAVYLRGPKPQRAGRSALARRMADPGQNPS